MSEQNKDPYKTDNQSSKGKVNKRYSSRMKKEVVLRALRGESIESLSRELGIALRVERKGSDWNRGFSKAKKFRSIKIAA